MAASSTATNVPTPELLSFQRASTSCIEPDETFEYDDLRTDGRHFRLLGLEPPDEHGHISSLKLHTFDINDAPPFKRFNDASLEMPVLSKPVEPDSEEAQLLDEACPYECALQDVHKGRRIRVTKGRYMGVTTYDTEKGDLLVMLEDSLCLSFLDRTAIAS